MISVDRLRGRIVEKGFTQSGLTSELGITPKTFYDKMRKGILTVMKLKP